MGFIAATQSDGVLNLVRRAICSPWLQSQRGWAAQAMRWTMQWLPFKSSRCPCYAVGCRFLGWIDGRTGLKGVNTGLTEGREGTPTPPCTKAIMVQQQEQDRETAVLQDSETLAQEPFLETRHWLCFWRCCGGRGAIRGSVSCQRRLDCILRAGWRCLSKIPPV